MTEETPAPVAPEATEAKTPKVKAPAKAKTPKADPAPKAKRKNLNPQPAINKKVAAAKDAGGVLANANRKWVLTKGRKVIWEKTALEFSTETPETVTAALKG